MEKDIPSLPSLPAIDFSGLDESFQDPSASTFSIAALQRSLSKTPRPPPKVSSASPSLRNSRSGRDHEYGASLSRGSDDMMISDEESDTGVPQAEILHGLDEHSDIGESLELDLENGQSGPGDGGSLGSMEVGSVDMEKAAQSLRNETSFSVVRT